MLNSHDGGEDMETFEADLLAQETEDRLTQLMLDEELSDARLGLGVEPDVNHALPHVESFTSCVSMSQPGAMERTYSQPVLGRSQNLPLELETAKQTLITSQEQLDRRGSKSVVMTTHEELTLDVKEKERLEDSLIIAG